jgi:hypothetical protein
MNFKKVATTHKGLNNYKSKDQYKSVLKLRERVQKIDFLSLKNNKTI